MRAEYLILGELRKIDEKVLRLKKELDKVPTEVARITAAIATKKDLFTKVKTEVETYEKKLRTAESDLREKDDFLKKAESKMMEVKTNEEYKAAQKENDTHKDSKKVLEETILTLMGGLEAQKTRLTAAETEFKEFEEKQTAEKKEIEEERGKLLKLFEEQTAKRDACSKRLPTDLQLLYDKTSRRMQGTAIVMVENCMCMGCNMKVRTQLYNEILGLKAVHKCPSCNRLLITHEVDAEVTAL